ncbi:MAG: transcription-repair coupling factor [Planctomycetaceae bacterium]
MAAKRTPSVLQLSDLPPLVRETPGFAEVRAALAAGQTGLIDGVWGSASALACAALLPPSATAGEPADTQRPTASRDGTAGGRPDGGPVLLVVLAHAREVDDFAGDLAGFAGAGPLVFPAWESVPTEERADDPVYAGRLRVLRELSRPAAVAASAGAAAAPASKPGIRGMLRQKRGTTAAEQPAPSAQPVSPGGPRRVVVASIASLLQPVPSAEELRKSTRTLKVGETHDPEELVRWLHERGFTRVPAIELPGEFCMHGGILDLFPYAETDPVRIEFFGDEIESLRRFDAQTQRKIEALSSLSLLTVARPARASEDETEEEAEDEDDEALIALSQYARRRSGPAPAAILGESHVADWLPAGSWVALVDLVEIHHEGRQYLQRLENPRGYFSVDGAMSRLNHHPRVVISAISEHGYATACHLCTESIEKFQAPVAQVVEELDRIVAGDQAELPGERVVLACHNAGELQRVRELFAASRVGQSGRQQLCEGRLVRGFRLVQQQLVVLGDHELFHRREVRRATRKQTSSTPTRAIDSFLDLREGDLVVHLTKGIARYRGLQLMAKGDQQEEHLALEFKDGVRVYVPVALIHLVQKYVGGAKSAPGLSPVTGTGWEKKKLAAARAVADLAGDMLTLQAARESKPGIACPPDSQWQDEFEQAFPYDPTPDQLAAIDAIKQDMQRTRPMDRLICGDVGYGKTEVAMRAAFKAMDGGRQVAVLVPTTVLAEQHFRTFTERMAEFPFRIEVLSRFRSAKETRAVLEGLEQGSVDLVIGTHRLVSPDVKFSELGLLIIDEEQRFGVEAKEKLKALRLEVDVLTLSATPIPRTLHLSLLGVRDISNLQTPPVDRVAVETRVCRYDHDLIRRAIVRELNRGGQIYFVHNRVYNIETIADRLQTIVPEARIGIIHGQMGEGELEPTMVAFVDGRLDILVATTIIESGLDIPNANTIFIHQADKYGLADLHQLRGRVGRYKNRAYCYLLLEAGQSLTGSAARRLKAIEEFSELGAGFKIAMRDLEIRGAGNILGTEQSGHIAAVGYELYCQLLESAVRALKKEPVRELAQVAIDLPIEAFLPSTYVPEGRPKIEVYRRFSRIQTAEELRDLELELVDRFGPLPKPAEMLGELKRIQLLSQPWQIDDIHIEPGYLVLKYRNPARIRQLVRASNNRLRVVDERSAYLPLAPEMAQGQPLLALTKALLQQSVVLV